MIRKLKVKFICLAMAILFVMLAIVVATMNIINYNTLVTEADEVLLFISVNKGTFPDRNNAHSGKFPNHLSPEAPYESRYFSVLVSQSGNIINTETSKIASVDSIEAEDYANEVINFYGSSGFSGDFRYLRSLEGTDTRITFLDCGRKLEDFNDYLQVSIGIALAGLLVMFVVVVFVSGKIVQPVAESYEKQKRFITDAGHEIKTPLTIINANVDMLESDPTDLDCLNDIRTQAERLTSLTNDLVYLAKMEESGDTVELVDMPISDAILESVVVFKTLIQNQEKEFFCSIQPMLSMKGNHKAIQQLVSILMDNAIKYSPTGGTIAVSLVKHNRTLQLNVYNTTEGLIEQRNLENVFERFYRTDQSRNSATGGHGIGLSLAKVIVEAHNGKIQAWTKDGYSFNITCSFYV